jgi:hypothetical protein
MRQTPKPTMIRLPHRGPANHSDASDPYSPACCLNVTDTSCVTLIHIKEQKYMTVLLSWNYCKNNVLLMI